MVMVVVVLVVVVVMTMTMMMRMMMTCIGQEIHALRKYVAEFCSELLVVKFVILFLK
jgi:hypothetical protein